MQFWFYSGFSLLQEPGFNAIMVTIYVQGPLTIVTLEIVHKILYALKVHKMARHLS